MAQKRVNGRKVKGKVSFWGLIFVSFGRKMYFCTGKVFVSDFGTCVAEFGTYVLDFETQVAESGTKNSIRRKNILSV